MSNKMTLADCVRLAEFAHFHQRDKAGEEYVRHPKRVMVSVQAQGAMPYVQMAAVLHDVTEDTAFTPDMLLALGVPEAAVEIVKLVDRGVSKKVYDYLWNIRMSMVMDRPKVDGEWDYEGFDRERGLFGIRSADEFYYANIKKNPGAVQVKLADIGDNLQPWRLSYLPEETQARLRAKYAKAIELLS